MQSAAPLGSLPAGSVAAVAVRFFLLLPQRESRPRLAVCLNCCPPSAHTIAHQFQNNVLGAVTVTLEQTPYSSPRVRMRGSVKMWC